MFTEYVSFYGYPGKTPREKAFFGAPLSPAS